MFFFGQLSATPTLPNFQADIIGLITGAITTTAGLSSNFVVANCKIVSTVAPGWSVADAAAGTVTNGITPKVASAPWSDDGTKAKFVRLSGDASASSLAFEGYETWNSTAHTGTNRHMAPTSSGWMCQAPSANSWVLVSASPNHLLVIIFTNSLISTAGSTHYFLSEYAREDAWNTVANAYPAWFTSGSNSSTGSPSVVANQNLVHSRIPAIAATVTDLTSVLAVATNNGIPRFKITTVGGVGAEATGLPGLEQASNYGPAAKCYSMDASKTPAYYLCPLRLSPGGDGPALYGAQMFGSITAKTPFVYAFRYVWQQGDEVDIAGTRYFVWNMGSNAPYLVKEA